MIGRELHRIRFAILLLHVNEEFGGAAGRFDIRNDGDELVVGPLVGDFHGVGVVGGDGVRADGEDALVFALERVSVLRAKETRHIPVVAGKGRRGSHSG